MWSGVQFPTAAVFAICCFSGSAAFATVSVFVLWKFNVGRYIYGKAKCPECGAIYDRPLLYDRPLFAAKTGYGRYEPRPNCG